MFGKRQHEPGDRILAILEADPEQGTVTVLGEGHYEGMFERGDDGAQQQPIPRREAMLRLLRGDRVAARLRLDTGEVVWGDECHWGDLASGLEWLHGFRDVRTSTMAEAKARALADSQALDERHERIARKETEWRVDQPPDVRAWRCE